MNAQVVYSGIGLFFALLLLHILIWRLRTPKNDVVALFALFIFCPAAAAGSLLLAIPFSLDNPSLSATDVLQIFVLHAALALAYIANYPAVTAHSPSLAILTIIGASERGRLTGEEIIRLYGNEHTIIRRVEDLEVYGMLARRGGTFSLKPAAKFIIRIYILYRKLLGMPPGEG